MRILLAPLDWGLGHAARCIPLIRTLRELGHEVTVYATGGGRRLLQGEFPDLEIGALPGYAMRYARRPFLLPLVLAAQLPLFFLSMAADRRRARILARRHGAQLVISDGRYGFRVPGLPCVFVTHQLRILPPGPRRWRKAASALPTFLNRLALRSFSEIWVPDFAGSRNLSGRLGHPGAGWGRHRIRYIGPLSRFLRPTRETQEADAEGPAIDVLALVSGPEPQRSLFEAALARVLDKLPGTRVLARGLPEAAPPPAAASFSEPAPGGFTVYDHLSERRLLPMLAQARVVVCRSGYTTVMELAGMGKAKALFIPTPGQPEQEYLAEHLRGAGCAAQDEGEDLEAALRRAQASTGLAGFSSEGSAPSLREFLAKHPLLLL